MIAVALLPQVSEDDIVVADTEVKRRIGHDGRNAGRGDQLVPIIDIDGEIVVARVAFRSAVDISAVGNGAAADVSLFLIGM